MKFKVAKSDLDAVLKTAKITISSQDDISSHYLFRYRADESAMEVLTYNGTVFSCTPVIGFLFEDATAPDSDVTFSVEGKRLESWISVVGDGEVVSLEYDADEKLVIAHEARGKQKFQSLDPAFFPFWDQTLKKAKSVGKTKANRLHDALDHTRRFVSDQESSMPSLCVTEFRNGSLWATDRRALAAVDVPGMENSNFRFHYKNLGSMTKFLKKLGDAEVEVKEHERMCFIELPNGTLIGETQFTARFPDMKLNREAEEPYRWTLNKEEVEKAVQWLQSGADWDDDRVYMRVKDDSLLMSMKSTSGDMIDFSINLVDCHEEDDALPLPENGVAISNSYILKAIAGHSGETFVAEVGPAPNRGGLFRVVDERSENKYFTVIAWLI